MKLFLHYLRSKALKIGAFLLFALLFLVSFRLYHLPLAAVWYPSALCVALGLVILLLDFRRVRQRHLELQQILKSLPTLPETLPQPQAVLEEDYRALTRALLAQQRTLETQLNSRYQDMLDYYTLWAAPDQDAHRLHAPFPAAGGHAQGPAAAAGAFARGAVCRDGHGLSAADGRRQRLCAAHLRS